MTTEIQAFVTLDELLGLRFECHGCHSKFMIPLSGESRLLKVSERTDPLRCPHCGEDWFQGSHDERLLLLNKFISAVNDVRTKKMAFDVSLEINQRAVLPRASGDKD